VTHLPKAVVFDFGGVIITPISDKFPRLAERMGLTIPETFELLLGPMHESTDDHPWHRCERGEITVAEIQPIVTELAAAEGITLHGDEMDILFEPIYSYRSEVLARIAAIKADGHLTGLLTNSVKEYRPRLEAEIDMSLFDVFIDSSEVGLRKPEPAIFELTAARLGVGAEEILYLDDFIGNVEGARAAGWTTIHVTSETQLLAELDAALLQAP
jgi:epoxide hydrolase-like predicted phosphatase